MAAAQDRRVHSGCSCLLVLILAGLLFLGSCQTEVGWSWFYPLGSLESDVKQTLELHKLDCVLDKARLRVGSRAGYACLHLATPQSSAGLSALAEKARMSRPPGEKVDADEQQALVSSRLRAFPEAVRLEVEQALRDGACEVYSGQRDVGKVELETILYLKKSGKVYITFFYRYG